MSYATQRLRYQWYVRVIHRGASCGIDCVLLAKAWSLPTKFVSPPSIPGRLVPHSSKKIIQHHVQRPKRSNAKEAVRGGEWGVGGIINTPTHRHYGVDRSYGEQKVGGFDYYFSLYSNGGC